MTHCTAPTIIRKTPTCLFPHLTHEGFFSTLLASLQELTVYLETQKRVGDTVEVTISREGQAQTVSVELAERPET